MYYAAIFMVVYILSSSPPSVSFFVVKDKLSPHLEKTTCEERLTELEGEVNSLPESLPHTIIESACKTRQDWEDSMGYDLWYNEKGQEI